MTAVPHTESGSQSLEISESVLRKIMSQPIRAHLRVRGVERTHPRVISRDLESIKRCGTINEIAVKMEELKARWMNLGVFKDVQYNIEPTEDGGKEDVCVNVDVSEAKPKQSIGVFTTETFAPEIKVSFENTLGGRYTITGNYVPPASRTHAVSASILSNVPWVGQRAEYSMGVRNEARNCQLASTERIEEVKVTTSNEKVGFSSHVTIGFRRRTMAGKDYRNLPQELLDDFACRRDGFLRNELRITSTAYHADPVLYNRYPLPIYGSEFSSTTEFAGGPLSGENAFLKSEMQGTRYMPLGLHFSLQWSLKVAGIYSFFKSHTPLNDRFFLSTCHVRGHKSIGPSTLDIPEGRGGRYAATGGNALWASSVSLNFPLPLFPENGMAAMHLFANVGNLKYCRSLDDLLNAKSWLSTCVGSIGAGIVITRIPLFGASPSGRFELNVCFPVRITEGGSLSLSSANKNLFDTLKFGLVWSSALSI